MSRLILVRGRSYPGETSDDECTAGTRKKYAVVQIASSTPGKSRRTHRRSRDREFVSGERVRRVDQVTQDSSQFHRRLIRLDVHLRGDVEWQRQVVVARL